MNHALTAEDLFSEMRRMPAPERARFFSLLTGNAFRDDDWKHSPRLMSRPAPYRVQRPFSPTP